MEGPGRGARLDTAVQGGWRQERSALQSRPLPLEGTLAGCVIRLVARRWREVPPRVVVPLRAVVSRPTAGITTRAEGLLDAMCLGHAFRSARPCSASPGLPRGARVAVPVGCPAGPCPRRASCPRGCVIRLGVSRRCVALGSPRWETPGRWHYELLRSVERYDPALSGGAGCCAGDGVVPRRVVRRGCGLNGRRLRLRSMERYDPATNAWEEVAPMVTARHSPCVAVL